MNSDEMACHGPRPAALNEFILCRYARRECDLATTALRQVAHLRMSGPEGIRREAIHTVRSWIRNTN